MTSQYLLFCISLFLAETVNANPEPTVILTGVEPPTEAVTEPPTDQPTEGVTEPPLDEEAIFGHVTFESCATTISAASFVGTLSSALNINPMRISVSGQVGGQVDFKIVPEEGATGTDLLDVLSEFRALADASSLPTFQCPVDYTHAPYATTVGLTCQGAVSFFTIFVGDVPDDNDQAAFLHDLSTDFYALMDQTKNYCDMSTGDVTHASMPSINFADAAGGFLTTGQVEFRLEGKSAPRCMANIAKAVSMLPETLVLGAAKMPKQKALTPSMTTAIGGTCSVDGAGAACDFSAGLGCTCVRTKMAASRRRLRKADRQLLFGGMQYLYEEVCTCQETGPASTC